ncbi:hypothetical protein BSR28_00675 [Boudabousia liubingyangii]|uniref:DUF885 domain-containing protein n=1 Tax=Boudabousia liubingyangii TaxID=1921764 RepID=UPI00093A2B22|nr:DUF885 domain-containing protein [Boudabousia liubingyangii]OKL48262.1 hypothetical protein BSR28_00675 [Boudabousia liubingyangii]
MNIDQIAEKYVEDSVKLSPETATALGLPENQDRWTDYSPAGVEAVRDLVENTLKAAKAAEPENHSQEVTKIALLDRLGVDLAWYENQEPYRDLNNIACPIQSVRDTLSQMDMSTDQGKADVAARISRMGEAYRGYAETLKAGKEKGVLPAKRQVGLGIEQLKDLSREESLLDIFGKEANATPEQIKAGKAACDELADFLAQEIAPYAPDVDGVGRERYEVFSHQFVGHQVDLDETYEWGQEELARIVAQQEEIARELYGPGVSVEEAFEKLNADPKYALHGVPALQAWMQETADGVVAKMDGVHFDIPEQIKKIECCIDKAGTGGIFYTGPSEDFSRPGRMWWSVPPGQEDFVTWQELTTVYHEGVPGHHLQIGQTMVESENLNRWRRLFCFNSGHAEGWALYAEKLMDDLDFFPDQGFRMGLLDGQRLRAARVVLDIGVHLGKPRLDGQGTWDAQYAWEFMKQNVAMSDAFLRFEVDRYLGWPGQAPSYKVGQRLWEQLRDDFLAKRPGELKEFHRLALREGSLPLGVLREVVLSQA